MMAALRRWTHVRAWPARLRQAVAVLVVLNVALGLAFSVIGLRRQADDHTDAQIQVMTWMGNADTIRNDVWRSVAYGRPVGRIADFADAMPAQRASELFGTDGDSGHAGHTAHLRQAGAAAFLTASRNVAVALNAHDVSRARLWAARANHEMRTLQTGLAAASATGRADSSHAGTIADVETVVLMLFAAGVGLMLFRRTVAVRLNGELQAAQERSRAQARFTSLVQNSSDLISIVSIDSRIAFQTASVQTVLGHHASDLEGTELFDLVHPEDRARAIAAHDALLDGATSAPTLLRMRDSDGEWRHIESVHNDVRDDSTVAGIVVTSRDVSERVALEARVRFSAFHDELTSLANRSLFADRVGHALSRVAADDRQPVVAFLDVDDFKAVNDTLGHGLGDQLLVAVADRLRRVVRAGDTVARLGGDEFAVLIEDADDADVSALAQRVLASVGELTEIGGHAVAVHASIGFARGAHNIGVESLLANADLAMYAAKTAGKNTAVPFTPELGQSAASRLRMKAELGSALDDEHIRPWFQPTVDLRTGRITGFEALARWHHPHRGIIPPLDFIPIAEQTGQIVDVGRSVLRQACAALAQWRGDNADFAHLTMAVNLSARELAETDLVDFVTQTLHETALPAERLTVELTESLLVTEQESALQRLAELRALGLRVAIDDFGTGYSSLAYLERLPVDIVKIDKAFVDRLAGGEFSPMIGTITQMAKALQLMTIAEGIEERPQADVLAASGCDLGQGYLYSRPVPGAEVPELLSRLGAVDATDPSLVLFAPTVVRAGPSGTSSSSDLTVV